MKRASAPHADGLIIDVTQLAFFTTKKVEAFEELTWVSVFFIWALCWQTCIVLISQDNYLELLYQDYGIDFDDVNGPSKVFRCMCGSRYCRDPKNPSMLPFSVLRRSISLDVNVESCIYDFLFWQGGWVDQLQGETSRERR